MHLPGAGDAGHMEHQGAASRDAPALGVLWPDDPDAQLNEAVGPGHGVVEAAGLHAEIAQMTQLVHEDFTAHALVSRGF